MGKYSAQGAVKWSSATAVEVLILTCGPLLRPGTETGQYLSTLTTVPSSGIYIPTTKTHTQKRRRRE